jgi:hypothetical protein
VTTLNSIYLTGPAPVGGTACVVTSSDPAVASIVSNPLILSGQTSGQFSISTKTVGAASIVTITVTCGKQTGSAPLTVQSQSPNLSYFTLYPTTLTGGEVITLNSVSLTGPAPAGGTACVVTSSDPAVASIVANPLIPSGQTTGRFSISTKAVAVTSIATITVTCGQQTRSAVLTVQPPPSDLSYFTLYPTALPGGEVTTLNSVYLTGPAPVGGIACAITSSDPSVAKIMAAPLIPSGQTSGRFSISTKTVGLASVATITVTCGQQTRSAPLTVLVQQRSPTVIRMGSSPSQRSR